MATLDQTFKNNLIKFKTQVNTNYYFVFRLSQFILFYRVECEKLFCKTNLKLKVLTLIKTKFNAKP